MRSRPSRGRLSVLCCEILFGLDGRRFSVLSLQSFAAFTFVQRPRRRLLDCRWRTVLLLSILLGVDSILTRSHELNQFPERKLKLTQCFCLFCKNLLTFCTTRLPNKLQFLCKWKKPANTKEESHELAQSRPLISPDESDFCIILMFFSRIKQSMDLLQSLIAWLYWYFRPIIKWFLRQTTRLCELQRICYGELIGAHRTCAVGKILGLAAVFLARL